MVLGLAGVYLYSHWPFEYIMWPYQKLNKIKIMELKLMTFNVEWMINLFEKGKAKFHTGKSLSKGLGRKPKDVQLVCQKIAGVILDINPDIIGIQEGPPLKKQMKKFVKDYLNDSYIVYSMEHGSQSIHALVRKGINLEIRQLKETHKIYKHLSRKVEYYTWDEVKQKRLENFTRKPVVLEITSGSEVIELMVFHTKSKISKLRSPKDWTERYKEKIVSAIRSRQKLSAEMAAVRRYLSHAILSKRVQGCILMGDLNDGPNRDVFEQEFLIHNIVDELRGGFHRQEALMHHCLTQSQLKSKMAYTTDFNDPTKNGKKVNVLIDHILFSNKLINGKSKIQLDKRRSKIEHEIYNKYVDNSGNKPHERPSDHVPMTSIIKIRNTA